MPPRSLLGMVKTTAPNPAPPPHPPPPPHTHTYTHPAQILQLFLTFTNLRSRPEMAEALARAVCAPVSVAALAARSMAAEAMARTAGAAPREAAAAASLDPAAEATRQRQRATAWLLGVSCCLSDTFGLVMGG